MPLRVRLAVTLAGFGLLAGCNGAPADSEAGAPQAADDDPAQAVAGRYDITLADGTVIVQTIAADGTYRETNAEGAETQTGRWRQQGSQMCFDPAGDAPEACYSGAAPGTDGAYELRDATGAVSARVTRSDSRAQGSDQGSSSPQS